MRLIRTRWIINQVLPRAALRAKPGIPAQTDPSFTRASEPELHPCDEWKCFPQTLGNFLAPVKQHKQVLPEWMAGWQQSRRSPGCSCLLVSEGECFPRATLARAEASLL